MYFFKNTWTYNTFVEIVKNYANELRSKNITIIFHMYLKLYTYKHNGHGIVPILEVCTVPYLKERTETENVGLTRTRPDWNFFFILSSDRTKIIFLLNKIRIGLIFLKLDRFLNWISFSSLNSGYSLLSSIYLKKKKNDLKNYTEIQ